MLYCWSIGKRLPVAAETDGTGRSEQQFTMPRLWLCGHVTVLCVVSVGCIMVMMYRLSPFMFTPRLAAAATCWQMLSTDASQADVTRLCTASQLRQVEALLVSAVLSLSTHKKYPWRVYSVIFACVM